MVTSCIVACFNFLASSLCLFALQALVRNSSIRKNSFNMYVIFLIFPDSLQNITVGLGNIFFQNRINVFPQGFYEISVFVWIFYFVSNLYLNAVVAHEMNSLVTASHRRQKRPPPKVGRAWKQITMVYLFAMFFALWVVLPYKWSIADVYDGPRGLFKFGSPNDGVFSPMVAPLIGLVLLVVPITYVLYVRIRIAWHKLLPKRGRTRILSLFFMRIIIVFLLFYLPNTLLIGFLVGLDGASLGAFLISKVIAPLLNACQAYVTLYMVMVKDDIRQVVAAAWNDSFGKCCCHMTTTVMRRPSASFSESESRPWNIWTNGSSSYFFRLLLGNSNHPPNSTYRQESEWDEDDMYSVQEA